MIKITYKQALDEGLTIVKPRLKKDRNFDSIFGKTPQDKTYWILFTLKAKEKEIAKIFGVSIGRVSQKKKELGF